MRKSLNLVLAAGLAASAFASTAAASSQKASCGDGETAVVTKKAPYTEDYSGSITTPNPGGRAAATVASSTVFLDIAGKSDATVTITWPEDGISDYDLEIEDEAGEELVWSNEADPTMETVTLKGLKGCTQITAKTWQWIGDPTTPVTITIELG